MAQRNLFLVVFALSILLLAGCSPVAPPPFQAGGGRVAMAMDTHMAPGISNARLYPWGEMDKQIAGTSSKLTRLADGVGLAIDTHGLAPGETYTIWWVIFNNPIACATPFACGGPDLAVAAVQPTVGYATGAVAGPDGRASFRTFLPVGETGYALDNSSGFTWKLVEPVPGLLNPLGAEIHTVVRTHGAALEDPREQLTSFNGGCNPGCGNVQAARHMGVQDTEIRVSSTQAHWWGPDGAALPESSARLVRTPEGVYVAIHATDLTPGDAYTIWWATFNNPSACAGAQCAGPDMANTDVGATVSYATGAIADAEGRATFRAFLPVGEVAYALDNDSNFPFELEEPAPGLLDPMGAEIHNAIRTHGAALEDPHEQLTTFNGGCNPDCVNIQGITHLPAAAMDVASVGR